MYRCTLPSRYDVGTPGHTRLDSRQGHYTKADTPQDAAAMIRERLSLDPHEPIDVQDWDGARTHGYVIRYNKVCEDCQTMPAFVLVNPHGRQLCLQCTHKNDTAEARHVYQGRFS